MHKSSWTPSIIPPDQIRESYRTFWIPPEGGQLSDTMAILVDQDDLPQDKQEVATTDQEQPTLSKKVAQG